MASSNPLTNDELRLQIQKVYARFVSDVDPDRLSDWLVQENVLTVVQWQRIRLENPARSDRCRDLLNHLFSIQHPRAFLVVRQALEKENHYLLESIDNREPECGIHVQSEKQIVLQDKVKLQEREDAYEDQRRALKTEKDRLLKMQREHENQRRAWETEKDRLLKMQREHEDQARAWETEKDSLLKMQGEHQDHMRTLETEKDLLLQIKKKHEDCMRAWRAEKDRLLKIQKEHEDQKRAWEAEKALLLNEYSKLEAKLHLKNLRCDYNSDPVLVRTIITKASNKGREINGLAILDKEVFAVSKDSSEVEIYDSIEFKFTRQWSLDELIDPRDIGSCNINKCLYISNSNEILRVAPSGNLIKKWSTGDDIGFGLSITDEPIVISAVFRENKLNEYSPDGQLLREINLSSDARSPLHAIKLTNGHFVVSLDSFHHSDHPRVCTVDENGKIHKTFDGEFGSTIGELDNPFYLSVDGNGFVMVADLNKRRVLLLDSDLKFVREILSKDKHKLQGPSRIILDESNGILIVADNNIVHRNAKILIFYL